MKFSQWKSDYLQKCITAILLLYLILFDLVVGTKDYPVSILKLFFMQC